MFEWVGVGTHIGALFGQANYGYSSSSSVCTIKHNGCSYIVDGGAYSVASVFGSQLLANSRSITTLDNCSGINNPAIDLPAAPVIGGPELFWSDAKTFSFRYSQCALSTDWVRGSPYPTRDSVTPDAEPMSIRASWEGARLSDLYSFEVTRVSAMHRQADAVRTVRLELIAPTAFLPSKTHIYMLVSYTDSSGARRTESSRGDVSALMVPGAAQVLDDGVGLAAWALNGVSDVASKRLTLTTSQPIKQGTDIVATVFFGGAPTGSRTIYFDPTLDIA